MNGHYQFGEFDLDAERGILRQGGTALKLQAQPLRVLHYLLTRAPAVVSREELGQVVWGERGVHVELDGNVSYCVRQIRLAIGDSATEPVWIETLPKQGYRFVGAVRCGPAEAVDGAGEMAQPENKPDVRARRWWRDWAGVAAGMTLLIVMGLGTAWYLRREARPVPVVADGPAAKPPAANAAAQEAYLRGLYFYDKRDALRSAAYFRKAIDADPKYEPAYVGMANAQEAEYTLELTPLEVAIPPGIAFGDEAVRLNPLDGEAHIVLGSLETLAWNLPAAEKHLKRGLELSPRSAMGEMKYSVYLDLTRHPEQAIAHMRRAVQLDPVSFLMNRHLGTALYFGHHYDDALAQLELAREMEPNKVAVVDNWASYSYEKKGMQAEAVSRDLAVVHAEFAQVDTGALMRVYKAAGWKAYWNARLRAIKVYPQACLAYEEGMNAVRQGNHTLALERFTAAADQHCFWMMWTPADPLLDELRGDARFEALLRRMRLGGP